MKLTKLPFNLKLVWIVTNELFGKKQLSLAF